MSGIELTLAIALLGPAQIATTVAIQEEPTTRLSLVLSQANRRPADEQVEVMRALLLSKLGRHTAQSGTYGWTYSATPAATAARDYAGVKSGDIFDPVGQAPSVYGSLMSAYAPALSRGAAVEGVYLEGYGAVFTATLDATARDPRPKAEGDKAAPALTEWERTQRALRGETVPQKPSAAPKEQPFGDVLLKLLADNGKHFTALKDDERLTVAVTFRGTGFHAQAVRAGQNLAVTQDFSPGAANKEDKAGTLQLIGEMHLKQGEPQKAVDAYLKALAQAESAVRESPDAADGKDRVHGALMKLAQAYLAAGKLDEAREAMDKAKSGREKKGEPVKTTTKSAPTLPGRLTVSAPKKLLDQVGAGKITFDEFRKQATVEYVAAGK